MDINWIITFSNYRLQFSLLLFVSISENYYSIEEYIQYKVSSVMNRYEIDALCLAFLYSMITYEGKTSTLRNGVVENWMELHRGV